MYQLSYSSHYMHLKAFAVQCTRWNISKYDKKYWDKKNQVKPTVFLSISWQEVGEAMKQTKPDKRHWLVKHATGNCRVNAILVHRKKEKESMSKLLTLRGIQRLNTCLELSTPYHIQTVGQRNWWIKLWLVSVNTSPIALHYWIANRWIAKLVLFRL